MNATTTIFFDKYHPKANGKHSVKIRVTFDRQSLYYKTGISLSEVEFVKAMGDKPRGEHKEIALKLQAFEKRAADIIDELPIFNFPAFEKQYYSNRGTKDTIDTAFTNYIEQLKERGQIGTVVTYECAQKSLNTFQAGAKFSDVTPDFLNKYEKWMLSKEKSITTVGIYLRSLRTLFNNAISDGTLTSDFYPFGKKKYEIPTGNNIKKALTLKEIGSIYHYQPETGSPIEKAKNYWLFMYLCNGMNVKDMCLLKYENIKGNILEFERAKTARTKRNVEPIRVAITDEVNEIIRNWGNKKNDGKTYIFPILKAGLTPERERQLIQQITHVINDHMKTIAKALNIENDVTTYAARHSFATVLQRSGVGTEFISEALGHSNVKTTQSYLAGFEDESKRETIKALTAFMTQP
jgi:integrase/recombinase XerD